MKEETDEQLRTLSADVIIARFANSSKAAALNLAITNQGDRPYDIVAILDADNIVESEFLQRINDAYDYGITAIQAHRRAKGGKTDVAILDTVSEEINNSIFREGHVRAGLSSALIGSGMAFDYDWFARHIPKVTSAGEDKELELLLLKEEIYIDYLPYLYVYDEKTTSASAFYRQRRRWIAAQFDLLTKGIRYLPQAIVTGKMDYCDKIFQWIIPPRIVLGGFSFVMGVVWIFAEWMVSLKWWLVLFLLLSALSLAMPDELYNASFKKSLRKLPLLFLLTMINLFRTKGVNKRFIHTEHGEERE
jgi:cellulose synthase/poly-beta-1,6-N-acetylglucosamine synthase-like glycosyltransferase